MSKINELLAGFDAVATNPAAELNKHIEGGKKVIGCFPYYCPEELVTAAGMVPMGIWGAEGTIKAAKEYFPSFYCTIAQMNLEMGLNGTLNKLSGVIVSTLCDTLRPLSQNFRVAVPQIPYMFLAHPQNRKEDFGIKFTIAQFNKIKVKLEEIGGKEISNDSIVAAIKTHNEFRVASREFVKLAGQHPEAISAVMRASVLKAGHFMEKATYTELLTTLNNEIKALPASTFKGCKVVTSGIIADNKALLKIFDENNIAIVADDIAHESRGFRKDVPVNADGLLSLAMGFAEADEDPLLYDPDLFKRPTHVANLVKNSGAQGVVIVMMQFCDPEEIEIPDLKKELVKEGIPFIMVGFDQQMTDFGQANTQIQAFNDVLDLKR